MNYILTLLIWCWGQVFVVSALAILLSALVLRRSPRASAAIAWTGVTATLVLTVLAPVPLQRWWISAVGERESTLVQDSASSTSLVAETESAQPAATANPGSHSSALLDLKSLRNLVVSLQRSQANTVPDGASEIVLGLLMLGISLSVVRVISGAWAIAILHRHSHLVGDGHLETLIRVLSQQLDLRSLPAVHESAELVSAAVVGWRRPAIVLPRGWREWSLSELQAVLAHELAHIRRRDPVQRLLAAFMVAAQCAQPLVYCLRRQLVLAQEMAADELAAAAVGSRAEYLRALSKLALRQDDWPMVGSCKWKMLLPVFSGFLLRRIEMLRATDGSTRRALRLTLQGSAIAVLMFAVISTTALRGWAQPPESQDGKSVRVARTRDSQSKSEDSARDPHSAAATLFQRPAFDLATAGVHNPDGFIVRLGEILRRPEFGDQARELDTMFAEFWKQTFPGGDLPAISLKDIDYLAGSLQFTVKPLPQPTEKGSNQIMFGSHYLIVRCQKPVNELFETLLRVTSRSDENVAAGNPGNRRAFVELPVIPVIGPKRMCVGQLDDRTLMIAMDEATLNARLAKRNQESIPQPWRKAWASVEGGLFTFINSDAAIASPLGEPVNDEAKIYADLFQARLYAIGMDWQPGANTTGVFKIQVRFDDAAKAERFRSALQRVVDETTRELAVNNSEVPVDKAKVGTDHRNPSSDAAIRLQLEFLKNAKIATREMEGSWQVDVQLAAPIDFPALLASP